jgi:beta-phosphoglucomutase-like phosphatase (HAD superfamily)
MSSVEKLARYVDGKGAAEFLGRLGEQLGTGEYAIVRNIDYVHCPFEIYPLAPRVRPPLRRLAAFAVDMDGTSTTTEPLALHALEYMVRRITGLLTREQWGGLDHVLDYPHVIGNSNFRHAEFLLGRYRDRLNVDAFRGAFVEALVWTLASMSDAQRRRDIQVNGANCGLKPLLADPGFQAVVSAPVSPERAAELARPWCDRAAPLFTCEGGTAVAAMLDIYYMRYHSIMQAIERGEGPRLSQELLGEAGRLLIEPMAGYDVFVPLIKGWLGSEAGGLHDLLRSQLDASTKGGNALADIGRDGLVSLGARFARSPARIALVTASIAFETHTTMKEVCRVMSLRVADWPVPAGVRERVLAGLADYRAVFDGFICASDACEHRLKPHRDLYSLALAQMAVPRADYPNCVGLEDTEPGIISLRASGIGCAVALPNHDTSRQDYQAAALVVGHGLPEVILSNNCFLAPREEPA